MARLIEPETALGQTFAPPPTSFTERDVSLYALATGAVTDPLDERQLRRVYERHPDGLAPLPTFFATLALGALLAGLRRGEKTPGLNYGLERVLHAEQTFSVEGPLAVRGTLTHRGRISGVFDKGRHGIVVTSVESSDAESGLHIRSEIASLVRSAGGFGGERGSERPDPIPDGRAPDVVIEQPTRRDQALLFRLLGDDNPLHADPRAARAFGLKEPILHGMCTLGFAVRHVIDAAFEGDSARLGKVAVRFSDMVVPGETLVTEVWRLGERAAFRVRVKERDRVVLSHGEVWGREAPSAVARGASTPEAAAPEVAKAPEAVERALGEVRAHLLARPALARVVNAAFQFKLRDPAYAFAVDLRREPGGVVAGIKPDADCILEMSTHDFLALQRGEVRGKKLYLTGALRMTGRTELAPHLDFLREAHEGASGASSKEVAAGSVDFEVFAARVRAAASGREAPPLALVIYVAGRGEFTVEIGPGAAAGAAGPPPVATLRMTDETFGALARGESTLRSLYMFGKVRVDGDVTAARALDETLAFAGSSQEERAR